MSAGPMSKRQRCESRESSLERLPDSLGFHTLSFLSVQDHLRVLCSCRRMNRVGKHADSWGTILCSAKDLPRFTGARPSCLTVRNEDGTPSLSEGEEYSSQCL